MRLSRNLFLAPYFNVAYGGAEILDRATVILAQVGVGLTGR